MSNTAPATSSPGGKIESASWDAESYGLTMTLTGEMCAFPGGDDCSASPLETALVLVIPLALGKPSTLTPNL